MRHDKDKLFSLLWLKLDGSGADWLKTAAQQLKTKQGDDAFNAYVTYSAMTKRKVGDESLVNVSDAKEQTLWRIDEVARIYLLDGYLNLCRYSQIAEQVNAVFKCGDESEQIAIIKGLSLIDAKGDLTTLAISTGRTNSLNLFAAIALNNPYPAEHYTERAFHQLVLKTLFMDLDIAQVIGLEQHKSPKLSQLAMDLVNERLAANRQPPGGIELVIEPSHLNDENLKQYQQLK